jgi:hypothetical protein
MKRGRVAPLSRQHFSRHFPHPEVVFWREGARVAMWRGCLWVTVQALMLLQMPLLLLLLLMMMMMMMMLLIHLRRPRAGP